MRKNATSTTTKPRSISARKKGNDTVTETQKEITTATEAIPVALQPARNPLSDPRLTAPVKLGASLEGVRTVPGFHAIFISPKQIPMFRDRGYVFPTPDDLAELLEPGTYEVMDINGQEYFGNGADVICGVSDAQYSALMAEVDQRNRKLIGGVTGEKVYVREE